jgi:hypothetical protein
MGVEPLRHPDSLPCVRPTGLRPRLRRSCFFGVLRARFLRLAGGPNGKTVDAFRLSGAGRLHRSHGRQTTAVIVFAEPSGPRKADVDGARPSESDLSPGDRAWQAARRRNHAARARPARALPPSRREGRAGRLSALVRRTSRSRHRPADARQRFLRGSHARARLRIGGRQT